MSARRFRLLGAARWRAAAAALVILAALAACAGELATPGEALRLVDPRLPNAVLREPYEAPIHAVGGLRPYDFAIESGELPEGITLQNGSLRGTPQETGTFEVMLEVSDANLNTTVETYRLTVTEVPPPSFTLGAPQTEVRESVTLRARVANARELTAARVLVQWDAAAFRLVGDGVSGGGRDVALLVRPGEGELQVDVAALGGVMDGDRELFAFTLEPITTPAELRVDYQVEFLTASSDPERRHDFVRGSEGRTAGGVNPPGAAGSDGAGDVPGEADDGDGDGEPGEPDDESGVPGERGDEPQPPSTGEGDDQP